MPGMRNNTVAASVRGGAVRGKLAGKSASMQARKSELTPCGKVAKMACRNGRIIV